MHMLLLQRADFVLGPMAVDAARESVLDFTIPYFSDQASVLYRKPDANSAKWLTLVAPFRYDVHLCMLLSLILSTLFLFAIEEISRVNKGKTKDSWLVRSRRYEDIFWHYFGALLLNGNYFQESNR